MDKNPAKDYDKNVTIGLLNQSFHCESCRMLLNWETKRDLKKKYTERMIFSK